jgi:hypothetical protein
MKPWGCRKLRTCNSPRFLRVAITSVALTGSASVGERLAEDYRRAAEIWLKLGEFEFAAQAQWAEVRMTSDDEASVAAIAEEESYVVRILAYRLLQDQFVNHTGTVVARRRQPSKQQLAQILKQARAKAAIEFPQW